MINRILSRAMVSILLLISFGCSHEIGHGITSEVPTLSALERYEKRVGIALSDIPQMYDPSKLLIGSVVEYETTTLLNVDRGGQKFTGGIGYRMKDLKSNLSGEIYQIEFYSSDGYEGLVELDRFTMPYGLIPDLHLKRYLELTYLGGVDPDFKKKMISFLYGGLIGLAIDTALDAIQNAKIEQSSKDYAKCLKEFSNRPKDPEKEGSKILLYRKIGTEDLMVQSTKIACEIYEIQGINKSQGFFTSSSQPGECIPAGFTVREWAIKVWISKAIPFGIVKAELTTIDQVVDSVNQFKTFKTFQLKKI